MFCRFRQRSCGNVAPSRVARSSSDDPVHDLVDASPSPGLDRRRWSGDCGCPDNRCLLDLAQASTLHNPWNLRDQPLSLAVYHCIPRSLLPGVSVFLLPVSGLFLLAIRKYSPRTIVTVCGLVGAFICLTVYLIHPRDHLSSLLEPTLRDYPGCDFITVYGAYESLSQGMPHVFLPLWIQGLLTVVSLGGVIGLVLSFTATRRPQEVVSETISTSWGQPGILLGPFAAAFTVLRIYRAVVVAHDHSGVLFYRYSLGLLLVTLICLLRYLPTSTTSGSSRVSIF